MIVDKVDNKTTFNPFAGNPIEKVIPITEPQKEMLASCIISGDEASLAYNESISLLLTGKLSIDVLKTSLQELLNRNEALRSSFNADGTFMLIYSYQELDLLYQDLSLKSSDEQEAIINDYNYKDVSTVFDLINGPLIRFGLFKKSNNQYLLTITAHHIVCDGWSFGILLEELSSIYNAILKNQPLPEKPLYFSDYAKKIIDFSYTNEYVQIEKYWLDQYKNNIPSFEIQSDYPRPDVRTFASKRYDYTLSNDLATLAKKTGAKYGSSFVNTLMSVFEILLRKYTGKSDIVIALPTAGQSATEMYNLIGHCVNLLPLRSHPDDDFTFTEYLKVRKSKTLNDYEHQQFTFGSLLKKLNIKRDISRIPLAPVAFNIDIGMNTNVSFDDVAYEVFYNPRVSETFELFLNIAESKNGFDFQWSYNTQLYAKDTIEKLMESYLYLLQQIVNEPETKLKDLVLKSGEAIINKQLSEEDIELIKTYNATAKSLNLDTLDNLFYRGYTINKNKVAVQSDDVAYTYEELNNKSNQIAHYLLEKGVKENTCVAVIGHRHPLSVAYILGVLKAGGIYVPIEPNYPKDRQEYIIKNSNIAIVLDAADFELENVDKYDTADVKEKSKLNALAYIIYTSGSTGMPKGVMITHKAAANTIVDINERFSISVNDNIIGLSSLSFDLSVYDVFGALSTGATLYMVDDIMDTEKISKILNNNNITFWNSVPTVIDLVIDNFSNKEIQFNSLRNVLLSGDWIPLYLPEKIKKYFPNTSVTSLGGATEGSIWSIYYPIKKIEPYWKSIPYGYPLSNQQFYVLDNNLEFCATDVEGELFIGGDGVASGYFNDKEKTEYSYINHPKLGYIYRTGDYGIFRKEGYIEFKGRKDTQVKIRGFRVELGEIEHQILQIKIVKDVVVLAKGDERKDNKKLIAFIIPKEYDENNFAKDEIIGMRSALKGVLPWYMIPEEWIKLAKFPINENKKIDRKALEKIENNNISKNFTSHDFNITNTIKQIWEDVLRIQDINEDDDFFELGGHSMTAIDVMSKIDEQLGVKLPLSTLFSSPTINLLTDFISESKIINSKKVIVPLKKYGNKPPIFIVHAGALNVLLYKSLIPFLDEEQPLYGIQGLGLDGDLTYLESIETIAARYILEVLEYQPKGPYIIMGYSFGGIIAFEMAKQLLGIGMRVEFLGILDTNAFTGDKYSSKYEFCRIKLLRQFKKLSFFSRQVITCPQDFFRYQWLLLNKKFNKNFENPEEEQVYDYSDVVIKSYDDAYNNYILHPLEVEINLFKVEKRVYFVDDPKYLGWKKYALKGVKVFSVPGDHKTFMFPPNIQVLAKTIQNIINSKFSY